MATREVAIVNKLGLHARASAKLTKTAAEFPCEIFLLRDNKRVNAKSIMGVMMLAASKGTTLTLEANGKDEALALDALSTLIANRFDEPE